LADIYIARHMTQEAIHTETRRSDLSEHNEIPATVQVTDVHSGKFCTKRSSNASAHTDDAAFIHCCIPKKDTWRARAKLCKNVSHS